MDNKQKQKLKIFVRNLEKIRGRHTELVSVYVPSGYDLNKIIQHLQQEQGTAENIKSKENRKRVIDSLERMIRHLKLFKQTPPNGLAAFAGNISDNESKVQIEIFSIEPPEPINTRLYRCDQVFVLDILRNMMETKEIYGLVVMDNREASIGVLKGTQTTEIMSMTSGVPGKIKAGGQCVLPDTLISLSNGDIIPIKDSKIPCMLMSADFNKKDIDDSAIINVWKSEKNIIYKIITQTPRMEIETSKDHVFFTNYEGFTEKSASELKIGDHLLMPEKLNVKGEIQILHPEQHKKLKLPKILNKEFAQVIGYFIGDGNYETDRLTFNERDLQTITYYKELMEKKLNANASLKFREKKNYYQLRVYGRALVRLLKKEFPEIKKALDSSIPSKILKSPDKITAGFLKGLFDAEGYVTKDELSIGMNNKMIINQTQLTLLRFGVIGAFCTYDNRRNKYSNNPRYTVRITDKKSLINFKNEIGFTFKNKQQKLDKLIKSRTEKSTIRQIITPGTEIRKIIEKAGLNTQYFPKVTNFFRNERQMSKNVYRNSILKEIKNNNEIYSKLKEFENYNLLPVKIKSIEKVVQKTNMFDIEVRNRNFIANGLIVHNSQARFARLREIAAHDFYKRIGDAVNKEFLNKPEIKGILVGGPGTTKDNFVDGAYINNEVKKKILGLKDLSYTGEFGLNELVEKSQDLLSEAEVTKERQLMDRLFTYLGKEPEKVAYGKDEVKNALEMGAVDILFLSVSLEDYEVEAFEDLAESSGAKVEIISIDSKEGNQLKELGGIAAILRFAIS